MAIKDFRRRLDRMERRFLVQPQSVSPESHAALARELYVARLVFDAEREALRLLKQLRERATKSAGSSGAWGDSAESLTAKIAEHEVWIRERQVEMQDIEQRCTDAGLGEEDIERLAG